MKVFKFGGASVCSADAIRNLSNIIRVQESDFLIIVVSAMGKSTNALEHILDLKYTGNPYQVFLDELEKYHLGICSQLFPAKHHPVYQSIDSLMISLKLSLENEETNFNRLYDRVVSHGELFSTTIVNAYLNSVDLKCQLLSAQEMIVTDSNFREGKVRWDLTKKAINEKLGNRTRGYYLTQGFIASDEYRNWTTLGREGSDYTAAILASCLEADSVTIWKDVPGVLTADPDQWPHTSKYQSLSYGEAAEMTYYGASVIHPKTIRPLAVKKIPLLVRSFLDYHTEGTEIMDIQHEQLEPAIIFKPGQCLISFQVRDFSFINESKLSLIFHLFEEFNIRVNMMQSSAISFSVSVDNPDSKMKNLINSLSGEFDIFYNDQLELVTVKNYHPDLLPQITANREVLLEQKTRKNYQVLLGKPVESNI